MRTTSPSDTPSTNLGTSQGDSTDVTTTVGTSGIRNATTTSRKLASGKVVTNNTSAIRTRLASVVPFSSPVLYRRYNSRNTNHDNDDDDDASSRSQKNDDYHDATTPEDGDDDSDGDSDVPPPNVGDTEAIKKTRRAPKRNSTAYILFKTHIYPSVMEQNPEASFTDRNHIISAKYKALDDAQRKVFVERAKVDLARYQSEMANYVPNYVPSPPVATTTALVVTPIVPLLIQQYKIGIARQMLLPNNEHAAIIPFSLVPNHSLPPNESQVKETTWDALLLEYNTMDDY